jgi:hypothetical protein
MARTARAGSWASQAARISWCSVSSVPINDVLAAGLGTLGACAALFARRRLGRGQRVSITLCASACLLQSAQLVRSAAARPAELGGLDFPGPSPFDRLYQAADGWVRLGGHSRDGAATAFAASLGLPGGPGERRRSLGLPGGPASGDAASSPAAALAAAISSGRTASCGITSGGRPRMPPTTPTASSPRHCASCARGNSARNTYLQMKTWHGPAASSAAQLPRSPTDCLGRPDEAGPRADQGPARQGQGVVRLSGRGHPPPRMRGGRRPAIRRSPVGDLQARPVRAHGAC